MLSLPSSLGSQQSFIQTAYIVKTPLEEHFIIQEVFSVIPTYTTQSFFCVLCIPNFQDFTQSPAWEKFELYINSTSLRLTLLFSFYLDSKGLAHSFPCFYILLILTPALLPWSPISLALSPSVTYGASLKELHAIFLNVRVQNQPKIKSITIN